MTPAHTDQSHRHVARASDERGAIFVSTVLMMAGILILSAFVIDLGTGRIARRDLQTMADVAALDVGRVVDGASSASALSTAAQTALDASVARNRSSLIRSSSTTSSYEFGRANAQGKWLNACSGTCVPNAVRVSVGGEVSMRFWPGDAIAPTQTAMAAQEPKTACITVGSFLAALDTGSGGPLASLLNEIIPVNADVFSGAGLVALKNLSVPLLDLATELGVAGTSDPLAANVSLSQLARAAATVLSRQGDSASTNAALQLGQLADASLAAGLNETIQLSEIISLGVGNSAGVLAGDINVFDLITGSVFAFDGQHVVNIPNLGINLPGFANITLRATVVNPPKTVCGQEGSEVTNSQAELVADVSITLTKYRKCAPLDLLCGLLSLVGQLLTGLLGGKWVEDGSLGVNLKLNLGAVNATARITSIGSCEPNPNVSVSATTALTNGSLRVSALNLLTLNTNIPQAMASTSSHTFTTSPSQWKHAGGLGTSLVGPIGLDAILKNNAGTLAVILNGAGINLGSQLQTALNDALSGLGLSLNGASVSLSKMGECNDLALRE